MAPRLQLQTLLKGIVDNVYFQPPANVQMEYPCIVYQRDTATTRFAGNNVYNYIKRYQITVVDRDPDSALPDVVAALPGCIFDRAFVVDGLNHDVFRMFF